MVGTSSLLNRSVNKLTGSALFFPSTRLSKARFANASACEFSSRGTQLYVTKDGLCAARATLANSRMLSCLICQRPDICSTTNLESIETLISASGAIEFMYSSPAMSPRYSATLLVAVPINSANSITTLLFSKTTHP